MTQHLLLSLLGWPFAIALLVAFLPRALRPAAKPIAVLASLAELALASTLLRADYVLDRPAFEERYGWIGDAGVTLALAVDGLSMPLVLLTALITPVALLASFPEDRTQAKVWASGILVMEGALIGGFLARDLVAFYVCWELVLLPLYLFVATMGGGAKALTSNRFFLYTLFGSVVMLLAVLYAGTAYAALSPRPSYLVSDLERLVLPFDAQLACFLAFLLAFAIKIPMLPLHSWSPETYRDAPTGAAILASSVMAKLGSYGLLRFAMPLFPLGSQFAGATLAVLAVVTILYGAFAAMRQDDLKTLIAYSSMSHMGFVVLGTFAMTEVALGGAVFQMVSHGITTAAFFLVVDAVERRTGSRSIRALSGIASRSPGLARLAVFAALTAVAVPTTSGFVGETMILSGAFASSDMVGFGKFGPSFASIAALGVVFGAVYVLAMVRRAFFGEPNALVTERVTDEVSRFERIAIGGLVALSFGLGIAPNILLEPILPAARQYVAAFDMRWHASRDTTEALVIAPRAPEPARAPAAPEAGEAAR